MKWIDAYATGVQRIDEQHQMIFKTAEDFRTALDGAQGEKTYGVLLNFLEPYCRGHFGFEERCMTEYHCPAAGRNAQAHLGFMVVLSGYRERYAANGYSAADARALVDAVDQWLDGHICRIDVQLKDSVAASSSPSLPSS
jgi:hemerythrin-like metal-binding protein